mmetsp:Transcript_19917/g.49917  ORF Transcript_19917/g.49917 Transcript_19917/m.49917 type:complete len:328 (+) Transcript_19917:357-1340(+)
MRRGRRGAGRRRAQRALPADARPLRLPHAGGARAERARAADVDGDLVRHAGLDQRVRVPRAAHAQGARVRGAAGGGSEPAQVRAPHRRAEPLPRAHGRGARHARRARPRPALAHPVWLHRARGAEPGRAAAREPAVPGGGCAEDALALRPRAAHAGGQWVRCARAGAPPHRARERPLPDYAPGHPARHRPCQPRRQRRGAAAAERGGQGGGQLTPNGLARVPRSRQRTARRVRAPRRRAAARDAPLVPRASCVRAARVRAAERAGGGGISGALPACSGAPRRRNVCNLSVRRNNFAATIRNLTDSDILTLKGSTRKRDLQSAEGTYA